MALGEYLDVLTSVSAELRDRAITRKVDHALPAALGRALGVSLVIADQPAEPLSGAAAKIAEQATEPLGQLRSMLLSAHGAREADPQRPFASYERWSDEALARAGDSYRQMLHNAVAWRFSQIFAPARRSAGPIDFDDLQRPEAVLAAQLRDAAGPFLPGAWWISRHEELGQSPLSALCDGRYEPVIAAAASAADTNVIATA
jgi:hypothetical protein